MNYFQKLYHKDLEKVYSRFSGIILDNVIGEIPDLQNYFTDIGKEITPDTHILISYHNPAWEPILTVASMIGLRKKTGLQNWIDQDDLINLLDLSGFQVISSEKRFFGITMITVARLKTARLLNNKKYSVSIIIPAKNEEGNISQIIPLLPKFGKSQEIIFVEGNSKDHTWEEIKMQKDKYNNDSFRNVKIFKQHGHGKANAVKLGFKNATGEILMIYDADKTVDIKDLPKFYNVLASGLGEFVNGSRMVYPMEKEAMRTLNKIGNKLFSIIFTNILGQRFKDTLCGTKAFFKSDYQKFKNFSSDPFGDFNFIFGAIRNNLKVIEIPIRYKERTYGSTNISRFKHGFMLLKMTWIAYKEFKL